MSPFRKNTILVTLTIISLTFGVSPSFGRNNIIPNFLYQVIESRIIPNTSNGTIKKNPPISRVQNSVSNGYLTQLILVSIIFCLFGLVIYLWRKKRLIENVNEKKMDSLHTAYLRLIEKNKHLEHKIKSRTEEVIEQINQQDEILTKLSQSEIKFEKLFSNNSDAMAIIDYDTLVVLELNQAAVNMFSLIVPITHPFHFVQLVSTNSNYVLYKIASIVKYHQQVTEFEISQNQSVGTQKWFSITSQIIKNNEFKYYLISAKNITKRKKAELSLIENDKRLKMLTENINDMIWLLNDSLQITYISPSIFVNLGYHAEELLNKSISIVLTPQSNQKIKEIITDSITTHTFNIISIELEFVDKQEQIHLGEFKAQIRKNEFNSWYIHGVSRDITEKKKTEIALAQSEQRYRLITNNVTDVIFTSDTSLNIKYVNQGIFSFLGYTPEELLSLTNEDYLTSTTIELIRSELKKFFNKIYTLDQAHNKVIFDAELDFIAKDGSVKWGILQMNLLLDEKNYIFGLIGTIHDNTQKHQIEIIEINTNNFFKKLFYESPVMMVIINGEGHIENANNSFIEKTDYSHSQILNAQLSEVLFGEDQYEIAISNNKKSAIGKLKTKDNHFFDVLYDIELMNSNDNLDRYIMIIRDITHQLEVESIAKNKQEQFRALSEHSPDIIARYNNNIECTYVNATIEKEFGIKVENIIGKRVDKSGLSKREAAFLYDNFIQVFINGIEKVVDFSLPVNGEIKHFQARIIPEFGNINTVKTIMVVTRNMTEYIKAIMMLNTNVKQMTFLNKAIIYCNQSNTKSELYQNVIKLIIQEFNFDGGAVYEFNIEKNEATIVYDLGLDSEFAKDVSIIGNTHPIFDDVYIKQKQVHLTNMNIETHQWFSKHNIKNILIIPIVSNGAVIGSINFKNNKFMDISDSLKEILKTASQELGSSINRIDAITRHLDSEENYRSLVETTTDLVWKVNEFLVFSFVNDKSIDLLGYTSTELIGSNIMNTIAIEEHLKIKKFLELNKSLLEKFTLVDVPLVKKSGQIVHVEINGYPLIDRNGVFIGYAGINRDISIRRINQDLRQRKEIAERMAQVKQQFVSNISHELRTPLTAIIGHTEMISHKINDTEINAHIRTIESNSKSLLRLISDILDLSKIEAGKLHLQLEPININRFFDEINLTFLPLAKAKNIDFFVEIDPVYPHTVLIDELRLGQILNNLVANALKFTPENGSVNVKATIISTSVSPNTVDLVISVSDTGIGIEESQLNSIFDTFTQADGQSNKKYGGSGLGLSICKDLVELMDGSISIESKKGIGSNFRIIIPSVETSTLQAKNEYNQSLLVQKKIGIIDNTTIIKKSVTQILNHSNCDIISIEFSSISPTLFHDQQLDLLIVNFYELKSKYIVEEIHKRFESLENQTIFVINTDEHLENFTYSLTAPIDLIKLHQIMISIIATNADTPPNYQIQIQKELSSWDIAKRTQFIDELQNQCSPLWVKASSNNSIDQIIQFEKSLIALSPMFQTKFTSQYISEFEIGLKTFDIEKLKQLLDLYPTLIHIIKDLSTTRL